MLENKICTSRGKYAIAITAFIILVSIALIIGANFIKSNPASDGKIWINITGQSCTEEPWEKNTQRFFESEGIIIYDIRKIPIPSCETKRGTEILIDKDNYFKVANAIVKATP